MKYVITQNGNQSKETIPSDMRKYIKLLDGFVKMPFYENAFKSNKSNFHRFVLFEWSARTVLLRTFMRSAKYMVFGVVVQELSFFSLSK